ncbi:conserved protein of unknown function [Nitrospira japonica]|uniref:DUF3015 domain-containing protein n=1 Tax=Nitrospira japonica TaxID=1325564 RepID=A0A1W1I2Y4_9BACT|nr:DUF3015 family protein [Nitrospira japonica]SLM47354.1 conserved protein of unknown function [Nitrospira japonica]
MERGRYKGRGYWISLWGLAAALSGCDATVELTKAPFDATSDLTDGISNASSEFLEPTKEFSSSTTPGSVAGVNRAKAKRKLEVFTLYTRDNLRTDISKGQGEYLSSLASIAGVPQDQRGEFGRHMQQSYATLFDETLAAKESTARLVDAAWVAGYGR